MEKNVEIVKALYDAFASGDLPGVLVAFAPQIEWREAEGFLLADGNPYIGPRSVAEGVFMRLASSVEHFAALPHRFIDGGEAVVVEGRYQGRVRATGKPVDAQFAHLWELRDGKIVRFQQYTDTKQWADAAAG